MIFKNRFYSKKKKAFKSIYTSALKGIGYERKKNPLNYNIRIETNHNQNRNPISGKK